MKLSPHAETVLANFAGKGETTWREIERRCGFSSNELSGALQCLRNVGLAIGDGTWGTPVEILAPKDEPNT